LRVNRLDFDAGTQGGTIEFIEQAGQVTGLEAPLFEFGGQGGAGRQVFLEEG